MSLESLQSQFKKVDRLISALREDMDAVDLERWKHWCQQRRNLRREIMGLGVRNAHWVPAPVEMRFNLLFADVSLVDQHLSDPAGETELPPRVLWPVTGTGSQKLARRSIAPFEHSPTYDSIKYFGKTYALTPAEACVVKLLHESRKAGFPDVSKPRMSEAIHEVSGGNNSRPQDCFRHHEVNRVLWGTLIIRNKTARGRYRLNLPDSDQ